MPEASFKFNDDLLIGEKDRAAAKALYPNVFFALDHKELRDQFTSVDGLANDAKSRSRKSGIAAVALTSLALLAASAEPLYQDCRLLVILISVVAGLAALIGAVVGGVGIIYAESKWRWLQRRLLTERLRQFHFQSIIAWIPDIVEAARSGDHERFLTKRDREFARFCQRYVDHGEAQLSDMLGPQADREAWLVAAGTDASQISSSILSELFEAYTQLRFVHQIEYASFKLRPDPRPLTSSPLAQAERIGAIAFGGVVVLLALHLAIMILAAWAPNLVTATHVAALWVAIVALAAKTIEEGLQPRREVERYRHYYSTLRLVFGRYVESPEASQKISAMRELEQLSFAEMVNFLKSNHEARFVM